MLDYLTLQTFGIHEPTRGTVWTGMGDQHARFECARCALSYVDNRDACRDADDVARILSNTAMLTPRPGDLCRLCDCQLT